MTKKPEELSEEVVESLRAVAKRIASTYVFGHYSQEDIEQEAIIDGMKAIRSGKFDPERGNLETFLYTHMRNRMGNLKRNKYSRLNTPCENCPFDAWIKEEDKCKKFEFKEECDLYHAWWYRNKSKRDIIQPYRCGNIDQVMNSILHIDDEVELREIIEDIEAVVDNNTRKTWLKMKAGSKVKAPERREFIEQIQEVLEKYELGDG